MNIGYGMMSKLRNGVLRKGALRNGMLMRRESVAMVST